LKIDLYDENKPCAKFHAFIQKVPRLSCPTRNKGAVKENTYGGFECLTLFLQLGYF